jgi:hypothetical protein
VFHEGVVRGSSDGFAWVLNVSRWFRHLLNYIGPTQTTLPSDVGLTHRTEFKSTSQQNSQINQKINGWPCVALQVKHKDRFIEKLSRHYYGHFLGQEMLVM